MIELFRSNFQGMFQQCLGFLERSLFILEYWQIIMIMFKKIIAGIDAIKVYLHWALDY